MDLPGYKFNDFTIEDYSPINKILSRCDNHLSIYTFPWLFTWSQACNHKWLLIDNNTLLIASFNEDSQYVDMLEPKGAFTIRQQEKLLSAISQIPYKVTITYVSNQFLDSHKSFAGNFKCEYFRGGANYIYLANNLALMKGMRQKHQFIDKFKQTYTARIEILNSNNIKKCKPLLDEFNLSKDMSEYSYKCENMANIKTIEYFEAMNLKGLIIFINNKPVSFSIYERLNESTAVVRFLKALRVYNGLYQFMYQETAKQIVREGYKYINLEDDFDIEGLRKAKLSYMPIQLCPNYQLKYARQNNSKLK